MKIINVDKDILGGIPVFNGTRVPVKNLFDYIESGERIDDFLSDFPSVQKEQVIKIFEFFQKMLKNSTDMFNENIVG